MIVGAVTWQLHLGECRSLKDKRKILKSLKDRLHVRFNVSVAETDHQDLWQRAELCCCVVGNDRRHVESILDAAENLVLTEPRSRLVASSKRFL